MRAKADMNEKKVGSLVKQTDAHVMGTGQFIFSHVSDGKRKMVLVSKYGQTMNDGYVDESSETWLDTDTWKSAGTKTYSISRFTPRQGKTPNGYGIY